MTMVMQIFAVLAFSFIFLASPEVRAFAFTPWQHSHQYHVALAHTHDCPLRQESLSSSAGGFKQSRIPFQCLVSLNKNEDNENIVAGEGFATVTGVTLKMAFDSSDEWGVADMSETKFERFTSPDSLDLVHRLRRESCAVLVGKGTVEKDNCTLTVRRVELGHGKRQPIRVVIDPSLTLLDGNYSLFIDGMPTIIYHLRTKSHAIAPSSNVDLVGLESSKEEGGRKTSIPPIAVLKDLYARGFHHIMVEGGPTTAREFINAGIIDRAILIRAPFKFKNPLPAMMDENMLRTAGLQLIGTSLLGGDKIEYWSRNGLPWPTQQFQQWP